MLGLSRFVYMDGTPLIRYNGDWNTSPAGLVRWALRLAEYDFDIKYRKGNENSNADALSILPVDIRDINSADFINVKVSNTRLQNRIKQAQLTDPDSLEIGPFQLAHEFLYFLKYDGIVFLVIPQSMISELLDLNNSHEFSVHMSRDQIFNLLNKQNY